MFSSWKTGITGFWKENHKWSALVITFHQEVGNGPMISQVMLILVIWLRQHLPGFSSVKLIDIFPFHSLFLESEPKTSLEGEKGLFSHIIWNTFVRRIFWCCCEIRWCPELPLPCCCHKAINMKTKKERQNRQTHGKGLSSSRCHLATAFINLPFVRYELSMSLSLKPCELTDYAAENKLAPKTMGICVTLLCLSWGGAPGSEGHRTCLKRRNPRKE